MGRPPVRESYAPLVLDQSREKESRQHVHPVGAAAVQQPTRLLLSRVGSRVGVPLDDRRGTRKRFSRVREEGDLPEVEERLRQVAPKRGGRLRHEILSRPGEAGGGLAVAGRAEAAASRIRRPLRRGIDASDLGQDVQETPRLRAEPDSRRCHALRAEQVDAEGDGAPAGVCAGTGSAAAEARGRDGGVVWGAGGGGGAGG